MLSLDTSKFHAALDDRFGFVGFDRPAAKPRAARRRRPDAFRLRVKRALLDRGDMTVTELAEKVGRSRTQVSLAINQYLGGPTIERIAKFLKIQP